MTDLRGRLAAVDRLDAPDLWAEARRRAAAGDVLRQRERDSVQRLRWNRAATIAIALSVASAGTIAAWLAFQPGIRAPETPSSSPRPTGDPWRDLQPTLHELPPLPDSRTGAAVAWTGSQLIVWGGAKGDGAVLFNDGFAFDAYARSWSAVPQGPLSPRYFPTSVWTGRELLIWGGWDGAQGFFGDGAAYDPAIQSWRPLPPAPIGARFPFGSVWTGTEMIVWGTGRPQPGMNVEGAAYDPAANSWRRIADAPFPLNDGATVWTGEEMIVIGAWLGSLNDPATETAVGAAYDPATDRWRELPPSELSPQALDAVWTGDEVLVVDYLHDVAAYDPAADRWRRLPPLPQDEGESPPRAAFAAGHVLVDSVGAIAAFRLEDEDWDQLMIEADGYARDPVSVGSAFVLLTGDTGDRSLPVYLWKPVTDPNWKSKFEEG